MSIAKRDNLKRPLYIYVYDELLLQIKQGIYPIKSQLPSEPDLAKKLGISRTTLRQALALLQEDGIVRNERGRGNFVMDAFDRQDGIPLDKLSNPIHKSHISTFDQIDIHYRFDIGTEHTKKVLNNDSSRVLALERLYRKEGKLLAYAFTFMSLETLDTVSLDVNNPEQLLEFLENTAYLNAHHAAIEMKYTKTVNLADRKEILIGEKSCFLLVESLYGNDDYPLLYNKFYIPEQFAQIKLNAHA